MGVCQQPEIKFPAVVNVLKCTNILVKDDRSCIHNHDNRREVTKAIVNEKKQNAAVNPNLMPRAVMADITISVLNSDLASIGCLPKKENLLRSIRIAKQKAQGRPASPKELSELFNMPAPFTVTSDVNKFLQKMAYTDEHETQAMVLFISEAGKNLLANHSVWTGDGTFATAPKLFKQLYFIGVVAEQWPIHSCSLLPAHKQDQRHLQGALLRRHRRGGQRRPRGEVLL